jgi:predicted DNA binding CopG/RHH family protein
MKKKRRYEDAKGMGDWYDEHEVSDENSTPTEVTVEKRYDPTLTLRIPREELRRLKELADAKGLPTATYARQLLLQQLRLKDDPRPEALEIIRALLEWPQLLTILQELLRQPDSEDARERALEALGGLSV